MWCVHGSVRICLGCFWQLLGKDSFKGFRLPPFQCQVSLVAPWLHPQTTEGPGKELWTENSTLIGWCGEFFLLNSSHELSLSAMDLYWSTCREASTGSPKLQWFLVDSLLSDLTYVYVDILSKRFPSLGHGVCVCFSVDVVSHAKLSCNCFWRLSLSVHQHQMVTTTATILRASLPEFFLTCLLAMIAGQLHVRFQITMAMHVKYLTKRASSIDQIKF